VSDVSGREITTIEGLSGREAAAVQRAWVARDVPQCGYCQSGKVMSAVALLKEVKRPTDRDIDLAMNGNLCRCAFGPPSRTPRARWGPESCGTSNSLYVSIRSVPRAVSALDTRN